MELRRDVPQLRGHRPEYLALSGRIGLTFQSMDDSGQRLERIIVEVARDTRTLLVGAADGSSLAHVGEDYAIDHRRHTGAHAEVREHRDAGSRHDELDRQGQRIRRDYGRRNECHTECGVNNAGPGREAGESHPWPLA